MSTQTEIDSSILPWLGRSMKLVRYHMTDSFKAQGVQLSQPQLVMLIILLKKDAQPQSSLAFLTNRNKASLARLIDTMEKKNLVERLHSENDKRVNLVHLTEHGEETLMKAFPVLQNVISTIQEDIPAEDIEIAVQVLKKIVKNIKSAGDNSTLAN